MYSMAEVAAMFGRRPRTIRSWIARGLLNTVKIGNAVFIPQAQVDALMGIPGPSDQLPTEASKMSVNSGHYSKFQENIQVI